jgi:lipoyl synthase
MKREPENKTLPRLPEWLRKKRAAGEVRAIKCALRARGLHTVCEEARCPNIGECFARGTATFLILGEICTRRCGFCAVAHGTPAAPDPTEPARVAEQVAALSLTHAVVTSVTRDDLPDGGAAHFVATIAAIRKASPSASIEVLTPDFEGREQDIAAVCRARPDVFNHNLETVERLTPSVRSKASYRRSLAVLAAARRHLPTGRIKSGLMLGLGETDAEVEEALRDLRAGGCDIATVGQYLAPSKAALPVARFVPPEAFERIASIGRAMGFTAVFAGPLVRSSYCAEELLHGSNSSSIEAAHTATPRR